MAVTLPPGAPLPLRISEWTKQAILIDPVRYDGRLNRRGFLAGLALWSVWSLLVVIVGALVTDETVPTDDWLETAHAFLTVFLILIPAISLVIKRLHDIDRSAWALLVVLIPYTGWLILVGMVLWKGNERYNSFGPPPGRLF
jgi:uncharacterized membrane protein YhaH (DUF805 family)